MASQINLVFVNKKRKLNFTIPVQYKSEAQAIVDMLDKKKVENIRISYMKGSEEVVVYTTHEKTHQLIKV